MRLKQTERRFLRLTWRNESIQKISKTFIFIVSYRVDHFIILETPNKEYKIKKNEFHKPTNAYVSRKSSRYHVHKIEMTMQNIYKKRTTSVLISFVSTMKITFDIECQWCCRHHDNQWLTGKNRKEYSTETLRCNSFWYTNLIVSHLGIQYTKCNTG